MSMIVIPLYGEEKFFFFLFTTLELNVILLCGAKLITYLQQSPYHHKDKKKKSLY